MKIDIQAIVDAMAQAALAVFKKDWGVIKDYATHEFQQFTEDCLMIGKLVASGQITEDTAQILLDMHKSSMRSVLITVEGIGLIALEAAINAAIGVLRDVLNNAIGFTLL